MKIAIMQPYLFPYLGYFQLIRAVDTFVVYDDVNYIKNGWINRNFILANGKKQLLTLPVEGASSNRLILEVSISAKRKKLIKTIQQSYSKAPEYSHVFPLIEEILLHDESNLVLFLEYSLRKISSYLGLKPDWILSSTLEKDNDLRGQEKVLAICENLGATHYVNLSGGKELYDRNVFADRGIRLSFTQSNPVQYPQFCEPFVPNLSITDVMMFNSPAACKKLVESYELV